MTFPYSAFCAKSEYEVARTLPTYLTEEHTHTYAYTHQAIHARAVRHKDEHPTPPTTGLLSSIHQKHVHLRFDLVLEQQQHVKDDYNHLMDGCFCACSCGGGLVGWSIEALPSAIAWSCCRRHGGIHRYAYPP